MQHPTKNTCVHLAVQDLESALLPSYGLDESGRAAANSGVGTNIVEDQQAADLQ